MIWKTRGKVWDLSRRGEIMGILNVTPDSFSDGGLHADFLSAMEHARRMIAEGVAILDVGGESTRPGASPVEAGEEMRRVVPVVKLLRTEWDGMISVDTSKASVAAAALEAGADIVNDVTGLSGDPDMVAVCRDAGCGVVVMHMQGEPRTMQANPEYDDVVAEVAAYLLRRTDELVSAGLDERTICVDPGIGFGKTTEHNLALLRAAERLAPLGRPLLLGVSRKSFLGKVLGTDSLDARDWPTVALTAWTRPMGVRIWRVHEVQRNVEALRMAEAILGE